MNKINQTVHPEGMEKKSTMRENWNHIDIMDKVERMRDIIKQQQKTMDYLRGSLWTLMEQMRNHQHVADKIMVSINQIGQGVEQPTEFNEDFF